MKTRWAFMCLVAGSVLAGLVLAGCTQDPNVKKQQYLERGTKYHAEGKYNEAIIQLKNAIQIDPKFVPALHALGRAYREKHWSTDALRAFQLTVEFRPDDQAARLDLAQLYLELEAWSNALEEAKRLAERAPDSAAALYVKGAVLAGKGEAKDAVELLSRALALGFATPEAHRFHGDALVRLERFCDTFFQR